MPEVYGSKPRLLFCPAWFPNDFNEGSGPFNLTLARQLSRHFEVKVLYVHVHESREKRTSVEIEQDGGVEILRYYVRRSVRFGPMFPMIYIRRFVGGYRRLYPGRVGPDLILVRGILPGGMGAHVVHRRRGIPFVTIESYSGFAEEMKSRVKRWWVGRILGAAVRNACVSGYQREIMNGFFPQVSFEVQTNVIAEKAPTGADPGDAAEELRMIYVGNIVPVKGWDLLLEALRSYVDNVSPRIRLTLAGSGDEIGLVRMIDDLELGDHVDFIGRQPHDKIPELISQNHFLVLPSRTDTSPNVILEAFMEGRPVLATASGGAQDMVNDTTGHLVGKESPQALCEGMVWMSENLERFDAEAIRRYVIENHSVDSLVQFLHEAIGVARSARA